MLEHEFEKIKNTLQKLESVIASLENIDFSNLKNEEMIKTRDKIFSAVTECRFYIRSDDYYLKYLMTDIEYHLKKLKELAEQ